MVHGGERPRQSFACPRGRGRSFSRGALPVSQFLLPMWAADAKATSVLGVPPDDFLNSMPVVKVPARPCDAGFMSPREPDDLATDNALDRDLNSLGLLAADLALVFLHARPLLEHLPIRVTGLRAPNLSSRLSDLQHPSRPPIARSRPPSC